MVYIWPIDDRHIPERRESGIGTVVSGKRSIGRECQIESLAGERRKKWEGTKKTHWENRFDAFADKEDARGYRDEDGGVEPGSRQKEQLSRVSKRNDNDVQGPVTITDNFEIALQSTARRQESLISRGS